MKILGKLLPSLLFLIMAGTLTGQDKIAQQQPPMKPVEFKGEAKVSTHPYKMEKGNVYRITVNADGFTPQVRIEGQPSLLGNVPFGAKTNIAQLISSPNETKEYQIKIDFATRTDLRKGGNTYTLKIERATLNRHTTLKDPELQISE